MKIMSQRQTMFLLRGIARLDPQARSDDAFAFKHGHVFSKEPLKPKERTILSSMLGGMYPFKIGECFKNAGLIALESEGLTYCEGMASGFWPVLHAWNEFRGRAIDVTWPKSSGMGYAAFKPTEDPDKIMERVEFNIKHCTYVGIKIPTDSLRDILLSKKAHMPIARHYVSNFVSYKNTGD